MTNGNPRKQSPEYKKLGRLHKQLATLYEGKSVDRVRIAQFWHEIERLEALVGEYDG